VRKQERERVRKPDRFVSKTVREPESQRARVQESGREDSGDGVRSERSWSAVETSESMQDMRCGMQTMQCRV